MVLDELCSLFLGRATDFTDHHDGLGFGVGFERLEAIDERCTRHGVATNTDTGGDADVFLLELVKRLIGEGAGAAHNADRPAGFGDVAGRDPDVGLAGADDARAVRPQEAGVREVGLQLVEEIRLVVGGHALGDGHDELDAGLSRLKHRTLHAWCRDEDAAGGGAGGFLGLGNRCVDRHAVHIGAGLLRVGAGHDLGAIGAVESAVVAAL